MSPVASFVQSAMTSGAPAFAFAARFCKLQHHMDGDASE